MKFYWGGVLLQLNAVLPHKYAKQVFISHFRLLREYLFLLQSAFVAGPVEVNSGTAGALLFLFVVSCHLLILSKFLVHILLSLVLWSCDDGLD